MKIIVASLNPVKINSVRTAFAEVFSEENFEIEGVAVPSGVPDQPFGDEQTLQGALNRADNASQERPDADFWVGQEGGIEIRGKGEDVEMIASAWMVVKSKDRVGKARTGGFFLPPAVVKLVNQGKELGDADDIVFDRKNSKQNSGSIGILTENIIDREEFYRHALIMALIPFKNKTLY